MDGYVQLGFTFICEQWFILSVAIASLVLVKSLATTGCGQQLPPGPLGIPIFGYIPFIPRNYSNKLTELRIKYGKVFSMKLGSQVVVVVSDVDVIRMITSDDSCNDRPDFSMVKILIPDILGDWNGDKWKEQRKFSLKVMRDLGIGRQEIAEFMMEEIDELILSITQAVGSPIDIYQVLGSSTASSITRLITGESFKPDHPIRSLIDECFLSRGHALRPTPLGVIAMMPSVSRFLCLLPGSPAHEHKDKMDRIRAYVSTRLECLKDPNVFDPNRDTVDCFMKAYLKEMALNGNGKYFNDQNLVGCAFAFFIGGAESSGDVLTWFLLYLMLHKDVQEKMRLEIQNVIGNQRISMRYRERMPYTQAAIQELHRIVSAFPLALPHKAARDIQVGEHVIPRGTTILLALQDVHMNEEYFPNPCNFDPNRFIDDDGKFIRCDRVVPFGIGKRSCPGYPVAETIIFLYLVAFVRQFSIQFPEGVTYSTKSDMEFVGHAPTDFPIMAVFSELEVADELV